ncbi:response regulator [Paenibacillus sp. J5C_2022]|uniref:response regulator transcription factor n=1 Tax=Paenibacillus sp. J5C2022 TaxID=2977129 RepID=UPI0021D163A1|nr:response regulator [Paenibacillus sp. J5C2022]MCU6709280.1 response regulator [Paenibacillus sp. J5C2022]
MKVLIVDDEKHVRSAIELLADWEAHGIKEVRQAADGEEAVELIAAYSPQIVLTDMRMPRKDGAELLSWLYTNKPHMKVIVISGYDNFEYVRHAVRHGGMDYILKPVKKEALNEALAKAANSWRKEEEQRQHMLQQSIEVNEMKPHFVDVLLTDLVTEQSRMDLRAQLQEEARIPPSVASCTIAVIAISQLDAELLDMFNQQQQLLFFALTNICNEVLGTSGIAFRQLNSKEDIVIIYWDQARTLKSVLGDINDGIFLSLKRRAHYGISAASSFPQHMPQAYIEASKALWKRNLLGSSRFHTLSGDRCMPKAVRLTAMEEKLRLAALSNSRDQIHDVVSECLAQVKENGYLSPEQLLQWHNEWEWMQLRWFEGEAAVMDHNEGTEELSSSSPLPLNTEGALSWERLTAMMTKRLEAASKVLTEQHVKEHHFIHDIAQYIDQHYLEDISLQNVAARFFLSREYIARKFKQEYGMTLLEYLTRIRIDKAKLLLHNPHLRIAQVAEMVGYQDEKYFSRVFKKLEGMNPGEFRKEQTLG